MIITKAKVEKLLITKPFNELPVEIEKMELLLDGIKYDRHFGKTRNADTRTAKLLPRGIETANLRMVTIVSMEEVRQISEEIGVELLPEDMEANIVLSGVDKLTKLTPGTFMRFPRSTILFVTSENLPCVVVSQHMLNRGLDKISALKFSKAALGKRGLTALVYSSGVIKIGDEVEVMEPQSFE